MDNWKEKENLIVTEKTDSLSVQATLNLSKKVDESLQERVAKPLLIMQL